MKSASVEQALSYLNNLKAERELDERRRLHKINEYVLDSKKPKVLIRIERERRLYDQMSKSEHWTPIPVLKKVLKVVNRNTQSTCNVTVCYIKCNYCKQRIERELRAGPRIKKHNCVNSKIRDLTKTWK